MAFNGELARQARMRTFRALCFWAALILPSSCLAHDVAVIAQKENASSGINSAEMGKWFKTDSPKWPDGTKIVIILGDPASPESRFLLERLFKVAAADVPAFITLHKQAILVLHSEDLVVKAVAGHTGAIGAVNVYSINSAVKVLRVDGKLPLEQGYLLHGN
jgi:hypothetical protein